MALGQLRHAGAVDLLIDLVSASWPSVRSAALQALARTDADTFISAISALDPDAHWSVRAALASALGELGRERAEAPLTNMLRDADQRVIPSVLDALAKIGATGAGSRDAGAAQGRRPGGARGRGARRWPRSRRRARPRR